ENEERLAIRAAEDKLQRALGDIDLCDLLACPRIDEYLAVGCVDIATRIDGHAFAPAAGKGTEICKCAIGIHLRYVGNVFGLAADINALAWLRGEKAVRVEIVTETPAGCIRRRALLEDAAGGEENTAVLRDVFAVLRSGCVGGEDLGQRGEVDRVGI